MSECKFKVGDRVSWLGLKGEVTAVHAYVVVSFPGLVSACSFYLNGVYQKGQRPSLKKLKKKKARYVTLVPAHQSGCEHHFLFQDQNGTYSGPKCLEGHWLRDCGTKKPKGTIE